MIDLLPTTIDGARRSAPSVEWLRSPARPALQVASALDQVRRAPSILHALRLRSNVVRVTQRAVADGIAAADLLEPILDAVADGSDSVTGLSAVHALAQVPGGRADGELARLVFEGDAGYEEHAAWAAVERPAAPWLVETLAGALPRGGVTGMHAQAALARWSASEPDTVLAVLERRIDRETAESARRYLTETIGLVAGQAARRLLERIAADTSESTEVRVAAIDAFATRTDERLPRTIGTLGSEAGPIGRAVRDVRAYRALARRGPRRMHDRAAGIRVAQLHLGAVLDERVSHAGSGDTGGVATLLSRLGTSLAQQPRVADVMTIGRAPDGDRRPRRAPGSRHRFGSVPLAAGEGGSFQSAWPSLVAAERGIRAAFLSQGIPDVLHLRMADPGSLAGALVAGEMGIPTVFTLAPDPHVHIQAREAAGELDRASFASVDAREAFWLRHDLVEHLAAQAREVALFPRADLRRDIEDLVGIDIADGPPRYTIVAEGVDSALADQAREVVRSDVQPSVLGDLEAAIARLPKERQGLPLAISVGRMHEVKGMARLVAAFGSDEALAARANLVIVGGDLVSPSPAEAAEIRRIELELERTPGLRDKVVLLGHRPNDEVALLLAAVRSGWGDRIAPAGAYVCGSRKEEFGLAIVEALAAGLPVVAPLSGGPASYVQPGVIGELVDTSSVRDIARGIYRALDLATEPATADAAARLVRDRFTVDRMAQTLTALYRVSTAAGTLALPVSSEDAA